MEWNSIQQFSYYFHLVEAYLSYYFTYLWDLYRDFPFVIQVAVGSMCLSFFFIFLITLRMTYLNWKKRKHHKVVNELNEHYGKGISYILSKESPATMSRQEILEVLNIPQREGENAKNQLHDIREKLNFCRMLYQIRISKRAAVGRRRNLHTLINLFGVQPFLEEIVNRGELRLQAEALHMMRAFKLTINPWVANQQLNSKRKRMHRLSVFTSIMSASNTDLGYFESKFFDDNSCLYDEIQLGFMLQRRRSQKIILPNLAYWAHMQNNPESQCIFIRLMHRFNQREYCGELEDLFFRNKDKLVVEEIARTWGYLRYTEGEKLLRDTLVTQADDTKVVIMRALTRIGSGKSLNALLEAYQNSGNPHVAFEALRCLYHYGETGRAKFAELEETAREDQRKYFLFFRNPLLASSVSLSKEEAYKPSLDSIYNVL